jgi:tRNA (mo5U34)-methyltransferase
MTHGDPRRAELRRIADSVPFWWYSIDLGEGVVTPGEKPAEWLAVELEALQLPDLRGRTVLDVGAWDGFMSFEAERRGAARVVALDHYVWSLDLAAQQRYWQECRRLGRSPQPYHELPELWHPDMLPGKIGFDTAKQALGSEVEPVVADFMTMDVCSLGTFDVVLYLGVLYHIEAPIEALRRLRKVTRELAIIETQGVVVPGLEEQALWEFFGSAELNADVTNWWAPNERALHDLCEAVGFRDVETVAVLPLGDWEALGPRELRRGALVVHARV